jgi:hypothetical protein
MTKRGTIQIVANWAPGSSVSAKQSIISCLHVIADREARASSRDRRASAEYEGPVRKPSRDLLRSQRATSHEHGVFVERSSCGRQSASRRPFFSDPFAVYLGVGGYSRADEVRPDHD